MSNERMEQNTPGKRRKTEIITITHSSRALNLTCPRKYYYRHVRQVVPDRDDSNLMFGSLIHNCLEAWHTTCDMEKVSNIIEKECAGHTADENKHHDYLVAKAMMTAYTEKYPDDGWIDVRPEIYWKTPLINPATGKPSWRLRVAGVTDLAFRRGDVWHFGEHKTASQISGTYLDRLWEDPQIQLYMTMAAEALRITPKSMIYNVLAKPKLKQREGQTEAEYQIALAEAQAKNKSGKSNLKRKMPETDNEYYERLLAWFRQDETFQREEIYVNPRQIETLRRELWFYGQLLLRQYRENIWLRNRSACWSYNRICGYWSVCNAVPEDEDWAIENFCRHGEPHRELKQAKERKATPTEQLGGM